MGVTAVKSQEPACLDLGTIDCEGILLAYQAEQRLFSTSAFDPAGNHVRFFDGGFSIWSGFPGAGKTTLIRQTICHLLKGRRRVFVASLEERAHAVLIRLAMTAAGVEEISKNVLEWFVGCYGDQLRIWKRLGHAAHMDLLEEIRALGREGWNHAFIDSLMCLDVANDDFEAQREAANLIAGTARVSNVHIHLVAHPRKLLSAKQELDLNDVAGAREIGGLADIVLFVRRKDDTNDYGPNSSCTPMCVSVRKQRHFDGRIGDVTGWFNREHRQFHVEQFDPRVRYLPDWAYDEAGNLKL